MSINSDVKRELRQFGLVFGAFCAIIFGIAFPYIKYSTYFLSPLILGAFLIIIGLFLPMALKPIHFLWLKIGFILGWINSRIILGFIFYVIMTPFSLIMRLFGYDPMNRKVKLKMKSYCEKKQKVSKMEVPF